jgi:hypothetical protein
VLAVSSFYIASKVEEVNFLRVGDVIGLCRGTLVEPSDVFEMERRLLFSLGFQLNPPSALEVVLVLLPFVEASSEDLHARVLATASWCILRSYFENTAVFSSPTHLGVAAFLAALAILQRTDHNVVQRLDSFADYLFVFVAPLLDRPTVHDAQTRLEAYYNATAEWSSLRVII